MSTEELYRLRFGLSVTPTACAGGLVPIQVCPASPVPANMREVARPLSPEDYNGIPLADVSLARSLKQSDPLHRNDLAAKELAKGRSLISRFAANKAKPENIINHYFPKK